MPARELEPSTKPACTHISFNEWLNGNEPQIITLSCESNMGNDKSVYKTFVRSKSVILPLCDDDSLRRRAVVEKLLLGRLAD